MIQFPVFMVRVTVKKMFGLTVKGKIISLMFSSSLGKSLPMEHLITLICSRILSRRTSDHIDMLENFMLQLSVLRHDTLGAGRLHKFKKSTDKDLHLLPPSKEALRQHIYHASYQAGCLWR